MFTVFYSTGIDISKIGTILPILVSAIFLLIIVMVNYLDCKEEINFILDFNEIIFPSKVHLKSTSYHQAPWDCYIRSILKCNGTFRYTVFCDDEK